MLLQTDELIDDVVYNLYGLTEEEIEIVEGEKQRIQRGAAHTNFLKLVINRPF